jgi:hypothetical protein
MYFAMRVLFMAGTRYRKPTGPNKAGGQFLSCMFLSANRGADPRVEPEGTVRRNMRYNA